MENPKPLEDMLDPIWGYVMAYGEIASNENEPNHTKKLALQTHQKEPLDIVAVSRKNGSLFAELRFSTPLLGVGYGKKDPFDRVTDSAMQYTPSQEKFNLYHMKVNLPGKGGYLDVKDEKGPWQEYTQSMLGHTLLQMKERGWKGQVYLTQREAELAVARELFEKQTTATGGHEDGLKIAGE